MPRPARTRPRSERVPDRNIPPDVLALLRERLSGLDDLEVLLFVRRGASERRTLEVISAKIRLPEASIQEAVDRLCAAGLLAMHDTGEGGFSYRPETPALDATVKALADYYEQRPADVMRILNRLAIDRIRSGAAKAFADAFVIGNGRKKDG